MSEDDQTRTLLTIPEVGQRIRLSTTAVRSKIATEGLPVVRLGSGRCAPIRVRESDLQRWLQAHERVTAA